MTVYAKLFTSIYQGTLRGNSHGLLVFTNLLAHCDKEGVADIHPRAIAEEVGLSQEQVRAALEVLESPDDESRSPEEQGRRIMRIDEHRAWGWSVVNYAKYRAIRSEEDRREQNREAQARWREKNKQSKPRSATGETDKPIQKQKQKNISNPTGSHPPIGGRAAGFDDFWLAWPTGERKQDKAKCLIHWKRNHLDTAAAAILADVRLKRGTTKWSEGFIEAPLVYLRGKRWEDGVTPHGGPAVTVPSNAAAETAAYLAEQAARTPEGPPADIKARAQAVKAKVSAAAVGFTT